MKNPTQYIKYLFTAGAIILLALTLIQACTTGLDIIGQAFSWAENFESLCLNDNNLRG